MLGLHFLGRIPAGSSFVKGREHCTWGRIKYRTWSYTGPLLSLSPGARSSILLTWDPGPTRDGAGGW